MPTDAEGERLARAILTMLIAGVVLSCAVVGYLLVAGDTQFALLDDRRNDLPVVRADRSPTRLPPG